MKTVSSIVIWGVVLGACVILICSIFGLEKPSTVFAGLAGAFFLLAMANVSRSAVPGNEKELSVHGAISWLIIAVPCMVVAGLLHVIGY